MSIQPVTWKSTTADYTYAPDRGAVYRTFFGQATHLFCGTLPRNLGTAEEVKQAILVKRLAGTW
ncbi:hypothetical protein [Raoultella planticola]|uniref:hypothetical protein n=1 Tax=Raoultella planticola TaxID=575 RepID=UPI0009361AA0|nr:hypothetical protein [Raoultella planticola]